MTDTAEKIDMPIVIDQTAQLPTQVIPAQQFGDMMLNTNLLAQAEKMAEWMSSAKVTVPKHLQGNVGDCYAIVLQSLQWRMSPFIVAQKTHLVNGTLGYEAQLVNAVLEASGAIRTRFHYEHKGDGNTLETRVGAIPAGESEIVWTEWLKSSEVTTKNSPLWKTNPRQQMGYLQVKNWARAYKPSALLGVYSVDELADYPPTERDITPIKQTAAEIGAASLPQPDEQSKADYSSIIADLELVAEENGTEAFKKNWRGLSEAAKAAIGIAERDRILTLANDYKKPDESAATDA